MDLFAKAAELGIQTGFHDGQGQWHTTNAAALEIILNALPVRAPRRFLDHVVALRAGEGGRTALTEAATSPLKWEVWAGDRLMAEGSANGREIAWPADLPVGVHRLRLADASLYSEEAALVVAPGKAYAGTFDRSWIIAVQLYGLRSERNWGIGDLPICRT